MDAYTNPTNLLRRDRILSHATTKARSHSPPLHNKNAIASITIEKINDTVGDAEKVTGQMAKLVPGEGTVATYGELNKARRRDDNLTAHHIPSDAFMKAR